MFLTGAATAALGLATSKVLASDLAQDVAALGPEPRKPPVVVEVCSEHVVRGTVLHPAFLQGMLATGLTTLTGQPTESLAWRALLSPDDTIGLKFNRSGSEGLGTTPAMAEALVGSLTRSGWSASSIVPIEIPDALHEILGTTRPRTDWLPEEVVIGAARDRLAAVLEQVTAIVNVPFIKSHNLAGMTCCLKNLSHALVKHPAQFHGGGCAQIAEILSLPHIRSKVRLNVVNGLRVVFEGGPEAMLEYIEDRGSLLFGANGVATDTVALEILNRARTRRGFHRLGWPMGDLPYLTAAKKSGLGPADLHEIQWLRRPM